MSTEGKRCGREWKKEQNVFVACAFFRVIVTLFWLLYLSSTPLHPLRYYLLAADKAWHGHCLRCSRCSQPLDMELSCFCRGGNIYCKDCRWICSHVVILSACVDFITIMSITRLCVCVCPLGSIHRLLPSVRPSIKTRFGWTPPFQLAMHQSSTAPPRPQSECLSFMRR